MSKIKITVEFDKKMLERFLDDKVNDDEAHDYVDQRVHEAAVTQMSAESRANLPA